MAKKPDLSPEEIEQHILLAQTEPFQRLLGKYLECAPTPESLTAFANDYPDRYARAIRELSSLAGYKEEITHQHNIFLQISQLSDMEVEMRLQELDRQAIEGVVEQKSIES